MAGITSVDLARVAGENLEQASPDLLRAMVKTFAEALMGAEADAVCGAPYGQPSAERVNYRNGYRDRRWDTRAGTIELAIPRLRQGSYLPDWLLERRRRSEQALISVVAASYLLGVSTRRVEKLAETLGIKSLSKSQVSELAESLDVGVEQFRSRPLDAGRTGFVQAGALTIKVCQGGRTVTVHGLIATGVNADGKREIPGFDVTSAEDGAGWLAFFRGLLARGLSGVVLVTSDAHAGLVAAIAATLPGLSGVVLVTSDAHAGLVAAIAATLPGPSWQRCRTRYLRDLLTKVGKTSQPWVATLVRTIFDQPGPDEVDAQFGRVVTALEARLPAAAEHLSAARDDLLAFTAVPREIWRQAWSPNPQERLNRELRRRTDVVGIFPGRDAIIRLAGAVLMEQNDERTQAHRYMGVEVLAKTSGAAAPADPAEEVNAIHAISA
jgi:putative transposase